MHDQRARRKVVIPGGSGHLGRILCDHFSQRGDDVVVLGRGTPCSPHTRHVHWDGRVLDGTWEREIDGADVVVNLAGRSVDCRYNKHNLEEMYASRIDSTRAVGRAIALAAEPPRVWLQMSTATIYAHTFDGLNDEREGTLGGAEPDAPAYWRTSVRIAQCWEHALNAADTPRTRRVALRSAMVMSSAPGGALGALARLARLGLGGPIAGGHMSMSWIHEEDFVRSIEHLIDSHEIEGAVNLAAPKPLEQRPFMQAIRNAQRGLRLPVALPTARWMIQVGAILLRTDPELVLKSRRVISSVLADSGFEFRFPSWPAAAQNLIRG